MRVDPAKNMVAGSSPCGLSIGRPAGLLAAVLYGHPFHGPVFRRPPSPALSAAARAVLQP